MWSIGLISSMSSLMKPLPYHFTSQSATLLFFSPMVGTALAELWGGWFNDFLSSRYIKSHGGRFRPEHRLWAVYPSWALGIIGLIVIGQALQHQMKWGVIAVAWAFVSFSSLGTAVVVAAYLLDVMPFHAAATAAWMLFFRSMGK
jgi:hypothetical protein